MTNTVANTASEHQRENKWQEIEHKHNMRCLWSQVVGNRTIIVDCLWFPRLKITLMVSKHYNKPIPQRYTTKKPWPEMEACYVYAPIGGGTWESLDKALSDLTTSDNAD